MWLQFIQSISLFVIALLGVLIAFQQMNIAQTKLQHDLYDRRFKIYKSVRELVFLSLTCGVKEEDIRDYFDKIYDAIFLYDDDMSDFLTCIGNTSQELHRIKKAIARNQDKSSPDYDALLLKEEQLVASLQSMYPNVLVEKFKPFLKLDMPFWKRTLLSLRGHRIG